MAEAKRRETSHSAEHDDVTDYEDPIMSDSSNLLDSVLGTGHADSVALPDSRVGNLRELATQVMKSLRDDDTSPVAMYQNDMLSHELKQSSAAASMRETLIELRVPGAERMTLAEMLAFEMPTPDKLPNSMLPPVPISIVPGAPLDPVQPIARSGMRTASPMDDAQ